MKIQLDLDLDKNWALTEDQIITKYMDFFFNNIDDKTYCIQDIDNQKYMCHECFNELDENFYCIKCNIQYKKNKRIRLHEKGYLYQYKVIFDVRNYNIFVYWIEVRKTEYNKKGFGHDEALIKRYFLSNEGIVDLDNNTELSYTKINNYIKFINYMVTNEMDEDDDADYFEAYDDIATNHHYINVAIDDLYRDNLDDLYNHPLFKYSCLKEIINDIDESGNYLDLEWTILYSLFFKEREYLYKLGLKKLAVFSPYCIKYQKDFKSTFKIDKSYLPFMIENNIDEYELHALQKYPTKDYKIIKLVEYINSMDNDIELYKKIGLKKLSRYIDNESDFRYYYDYIRMAKELGMDLEDNKVLFPPNIKEAHDSILDEYITYKNNKYSHDVEEYGKKSFINTYIDDNYIIIPARSIEGLQDESKQMHNCVRTYAEAIAKGRCQIYFMRELDNIRKSLVTIEVKGVKVVQAKIKNNEEVPDDLMNIIKIFESNLKPVNL